MQDAQIVRGDIIWMSSHSLSVDMGQTYAVFGRVKKDESNTSKTSPMSSDFGWLSIQ